MFTSFKICSGHRTVKQVSISLTEVVVSCCESSEQAAAVQAELLHAMRLLLHPVLQSNHTAAGRRPFPGSDLLRQASLISIVEWLAFADSLQVHLKQGAVPHRC